MPSKRMVVSSSSLITGLTVSALSVSNTDESLTVDEVLHAFLAIDEGIKEGPSHSNRLCTKAECFDNISTAPNTAVNIDLKLSKHLRRMSSDLEQRK